MNLPKNSKVAVSVFGVVMLGAYSIPHDDPAYISILPPTKRDIYDNKNLSTFSSYRSNVPLALDIIPSIHIAHAGGLDDLDYSNKKIPEKKGFLASVWDSFISLFVYKPKLDPAPISQTPISTTTPPTIIYRDKVIQAGISSEEVDNKINRAILSRPITRTNTNTIVQQPIIINSTSGNSSTNTGSPVTRDFLTKQVDVIYTSLGRSISDIETYTDACVSSYISGSSNIPHVAGSSYGNVLMWNGSSWTSVATSSLCITSGGGGGGGLTLSDLNAMSTIKLGNGNCATGANSSAFGYCNCVTSDCSSALGHLNTACALSSSAIGFFNTASGCESTASGYFNIASGFDSSAFGNCNSATGDYSAAVGRSNTASAADGFSSAFGVSNSASGYRSSSFGYGNTASGAKSSASGYNNRASGTTYSSAFGSGNLVSGSYSTASGYYNTASGAKSSAFGHGSTASGLYSSAFGYYSCASGGGSSVMGIYNTASGCYSSAIGSTNTASGCYSSASGYGNTASGCFASAFGTCVNNATASTTAIGINGGWLKIFNTGCVTSSTGACLTASGVWTNTSDRNLKENFTTLDNNEVLNKILALPVPQWNYKSEDASITHIGPIAQDFYASFGVGGSDKSISTIDPAGIALIGIKALNTRIDNVANIASSSISYAVTSFFSNVREFVMDKITVALGIFKTVKTDELCIKETCVTEDDLKALLILKNSQASTTQTISNIITPTVTPPTPTPDPIPEPTPPTPEPIPEVTTPPAPEPISTPTPEPSAPAPDPAPVTSPDSN